jgi:very-short-patch-repair endonuclease
MPGEAAETLRSEAGGGPYPPTPSPVRGGGGEEGREGKRRDRRWAMEADPEHTVARRIRTRLAAREIRGRRTETERHLWAELHLYKIDGLQFRQQHPVGPYIVDFCCYRVRLIVEIDGEIHEAQREYDVERDDYLRSLGYTVLRFPVARILHDLDAVLTEIRAACSPSPAHGGGGWGVGADPDARDGEYSDGRRPEADPGAGRGGVSEWPSPAP